MYVCMYVCMNVCMYWIFYVCMYVCMYETSMDGIHFVTLTAGLSVQTMSVYPFSLYAPCFVAFESTAHFYSNSTSLVYLFMYVCVCVCVFVPSIRAGFVL